MFVIEKQQTEGEKDRAWLLDYMGETGLQPTANEYAEWTGLHKTEACRHLRILTDAGELVPYRIQAERGWRNAWRFPGDEPNRTQWVRSPLSRGGKR